MRIEDFHDLGLNEEELAELEQSLQLIGQAIQQEEEIPLPDSLRGEALLHLLDGVEIRAVFQQMGGKGVAQGVRGDFCLNSGLLLIVLDDLPKALAAHALPAHIHEQGAFLRVLQHLGPHVLYVVLKRPDSRRVEGDHPLLSPAGTADKAGGQVDILSLIHI